MNRMLITTCIFFLFSCNHKKEEIISPIEAPVTEAVFAPGHIEAEGLFTLTALNDGYIKDVTVQEGDTVRKNQILFIQDNSVALIQQRAATASLYITEQQAAPGSSVLQQLQSELNNANEKLKNDKAQFERMQRLYVTQSVAKTEVDNAQLSYTNSLNNVASVKNKIDATQQSLQQSVINSRGQQQTALANNSYFSIKSPGSYKVYSVLKKKRGNAAQR